jgi:DNA invertase Pin-like site-specific DNA recombinase/RNase P subunit RPR2
MEATKNITVIPARRRVGNTVNKEVKPKLKVAAYCRVSTDSDEQATSYEAQVEHYTDFIKKNPEWEFAGIFADDGISGTNTKKREEFNRMIDEAMAGKIDMIVTKSISRFARNTLDCLKYIRQLKEKNIPVYFEKENINTMDAKGEVLLTIMASLAQQESQSLSQNVKLGFQYRYQQGQITVNHNRFLGYTKDEKGQLIIDPDEAVVVRRIYREYLEGASLQQICRGLEADGILTGAGKKKWRPESVKKILQNEKYIGDALLQKTYTVDFLEKKRVPNNGLVPQYYVENSHEAIIPRDLYMQVQEEMVRRANLHSGKNRKKRVYSSKYALSSIVYCSKCGDIYRRIAWNNRGKHSIVWRCCTRVEHGPGACAADTIQESELQNLVVRAINMALCKKDTMSENLQKNVEAVLTGADGIPLDEIDSRLEQLQKELLKVANAKGNYDSIADEIYHLREVKQNALVDNAEREGVKQRISEMQQFLAEQTQNITEYDEQLVRRLIEKITVYEEKVTVEFKSGTSVDVRR